MRLQLLNTIIELLPDKALFLPESKTLVLADLHLGKAMHFRKSGIPLPPESALKDYARLHALIAKKQPERIIVIGDLFHSGYNSEWNLFCDFIAQHPAAQFTLVLGNHDILERMHYEKLCVEVIEGSVQIGDLVLSHEPLKEVPRQKINIAGHVHPGFRLYGKGLQSIKLPCFYLLPDQLILPAFGSLTGLYLLEKKEHAQVFIVVNDKVIRV